MRNVRVGKALKRARERKGLTQKELAEILYVDPSLVCRWEKGQKGISLHHAPLILDVLGVNIAESKRK